MWGWCCTSRHHDWTAWQSDWSNYYLLTPIILGSYERHHTPYIGSYHVNDTVSVRYTYVKLKSTAMSAIQVSFTTHCFSNGICKTGIILCQFIGKLRTESLWKDYWFDSHDCFILHCAYLNNSMPSAAHVQDGRLILTVDLGIVYVDHEGW